MGSYKYANKDQLIVIIKQGVIVEASNSLCEFTGYNMNELVGKSFNNVCKELLRININFQHFDYEADAFLFTKSLDARCVSIRKEPCTENEEIKYLINEIPNSRFDDKNPYLEQLCKADISGIAVYSVPDMVLIKANHKYLDFLEAPFNQKCNSIGRKIQDIITGWKGSPVEHYWKKAIETGEVVEVKEYEHTGYNRGITYWDSIITPIAEERGIKYLVSNTLEVTDKVMNRKKVEEQTREIKQQKEILEAIIDSLSENISLIDKNGNYIKKNKVSKDNYSTMDNVYKHQSYNNQYFDFDGAEIHVEELCALKVLKGETIKNQKIKVVISGKDRYVITSGIPLFNDSGELEMGVILTQDVTELMQMSKELDQKNKQLKAIIENVSNGIFIFNMDKSVTFLNDEARNFFYNPLDYKVSGDSYSHTRYYDFEGKEVSVEQLPGYKAMHGEKLTNFFLTAERPDKTMHFSISGCPIFDDNGNITSTLLCSHDITELINDKISLSEQKEQLEAIINNMSDALYVFDKNGNYTLMNKAAHNIMQGVSFNKVGDDYTPGLYYDIYGNELSLNQMPYSQILKGKKIIEQIISMKTPQEKKYLGISGTPLFNRDGSFRLGLLCIRDITVTESQNQMIEQQKRQLEAILENMQEGMFIFDKDGKYILINKAGRHRFNNTIDKLGDSYKVAKFYDLQGNEIALENTPNYQVKCGMTVKDKIMLLKTETEEHYLSVSGTPIFDESGNLLYGIICSRNITNYVRSERALIESQNQLLKARTKEKEALENAMKVKDEFLATITHEFKTPLTVINAALQTIESIYQNQVSDNIKKHLQRIRMNSFRQLRLVNNLLDITRFKTGHLKINEDNIDIVFLTKAMVKSVDLFAKQKGIILEFSANTEYKEMTIDEEKYERILLNLLSNAIKFTPKGKSIFINVSCKNRKVIISVKDEGIGIPRDKQELIFERFGQVDNSLSRQAEGTGIGLSLVKSLVDGMKGTISVESEVAKGSTFIITLPIRKLRIKEPEIKLAPSQDSRIMQAVAIEFSDIYLD